MRQSTRDGCCTVGFTVLALAGTGCIEAGGGAGDGIPWTERDSAGVIIVENEPPAPESRLAWSIGAQPSVAIGSVDSGEADQLFRVADATRLSDGRIVIANTGSNELRVFNPDGSHAGTWGGLGDGPGEFTSYSPTAVVAWPGDSVAAPNPWALRLSLFDGDGNHGRDISLGASNGADRPPFVVEDDPPGRCVDLKHLLGRGMPAEEWRTGCLCRSREPGCRHHISDSPAGSSATSLTTRTIGTSISPRSM